MRNSIKISIALLFLICSCNSSTEQPNFLFILVDDLGYMDVGFNNPGSFYETPNVDRLASEGVIFTQGYAACPVCSPTRASIMTGKYPARLNTTDYFNAPQPEEWKRNSPLLPATYIEELAHKELTIAEALKSNGYATFFAGKWHLGPEEFWPEHQGFDVNIGGHTGGGPYGGDKYFSPYGNPRIEDGPKGEHLPDRLASETVKFIEEKKGQPFLAYLSFYSVHTPLISRPDLEEKYKIKGESVPENIWGDESPRKVRTVQNHPVYAGMVEAMDLAVGKVLDYLKESGLEDNTIVFFMSDNGGLSTSEGHPTSNLPLRAGKGWLYEGGIREPMVIRWPQKNLAGTKIKVPVISTDFYPTILELAGIDVPDSVELDGESLLWIKGGRNVPVDRPIFWHYPHYGNQGGTPGSAIRLGEYKLIRFFEDRPVELYNLDNDISETNNLADSLPEIRDKMLSILEDWYKDVDARFPTPNPNYKKEDK